MKSSKKEYNFTTEKGSEVKVKIEVKIEKLSEGDVEDILHEYAIRSRNFYLDLGREISCKNQ
ncbi:MAG: hypothetical protein NC293_12525 [Roseburia sp.]|nr:hypothetical protein [Roseburia sp.]